MEQAEKKAQRVVVGMDPREVSLNPPPDYLFGTVMREYFTEAVRDVCQSAFLQVMDRGGYNDQARRNRERISREQAKERFDLDALNRARTMKSTVRRVA
jgi:hypothetical protein